MQEHLDCMVMLKEEIAEAGIDITDKTFTDAIIALVSASYASIVKAYVASLAVHNVDKPKAEHRAVKSTELLPLLRVEAQSRASSARSKSRTTDNVAASANSHGKLRTRGKGRRGGRQQSGGGSSRQSHSSTSNEDITCFKCGGKGHKSPVCPSKGKAKKPGDSANSAQASAGSSDTKGSATVAKSSPAPAAHSVEIDEGWTAYTADASLDKALSVSRVRHSSTCDSGATTYMTPQHHRLFDYRPLDPPCTVRAAGKTFFEAHGIGSMHIPAPNGDCWTKLLLRDVLFAPRMAVTLISLGRSDNDGQMSTISDGFCYITDANGNTICAVSKVDGLYRIFDNKAAHAAAASVAKLSLFELHQRLGHAFYMYIKQMLRKGQLNGLTIDPARMAEQEYTVCMCAKTVRKPIAAQCSSPLAEHFGDLMHMDVWGPAPICTVQHAWYALVIFDNATRWLKEPLLCTKDKAFAKYVGYKAHLYMQHGVRVKAVHSDRGGEFIGRDFVDHLTRQGTVQKLTVHDTPEHNGAAKRTHQTIFNVVRALLLSAGLPSTLWGEALQHAVWLYNRMPRAALGLRTPYEARFGAQPDLSDLNPFSAVYFVKLKDVRNLSAKAVECRFLGFDLTSNGLRVWWPSQRKGSVKRDVVFLSQEIPLLEGEDYRLDELQDDSPAAGTDRTAVNEPNPPNNKYADLPELVSGDEDNEDGDDKSPASLPRRSARLQAALRAAVFPSISDDPEATLASAHSEAIGVDPQTYQQAMRDPHATEWTAAIQDEIQWLESRDSWDFVNLPAGANIVGPRWVFRTKRNANNAVTSYRARLVAQGYSQVEGLDFLQDNIFAPVAKLDSQRANLALAARRGYHIGQKDIRSTFLYGHLKDDEIIYMKPPPGVECQKYSMTTGCHMGALISATKVSSLYGLSRT